MFEDWKRVFGAKLQERQSVDLRTAELWSIALQQLRITPGEFKTAMAKSICLQWPPTAPADFLALGRTGPSNGYPDMKQAYEHAVNYSGRLFDDRDDWQHVVIHETAHRVGFTKLATQREKLTWYEWQQLYPQVCDEHKAGADFKLPLDKSKQLAYEHTPVQQGTAASANIDAFLAKFGSKKGEAV